MGNAVKVGDQGLDHDGFAPTAITAGSGSVKADGAAIARMGDPLEMHSKPNHPPHGRSIAGGSGSVFAEGAAVARTDDPVDCGGALVGGGTVNVG
jgi:uncharacterized Zn-binding protein involved in type VI secretion